MQCWKNDEEFHDEEFDTVRTCKNKIEVNQARREERNKGSELCEGCPHRIGNEPSDVHVHSALCRESELNVLLKGFFKRL